MSEHAEHPAPTATNYSAHRIEALADGVFAIAMTLLVIELKLPESPALHGADAVTHALAELSPKLISWFISFGVLSFFWYGHHRLFAHVRYADGPLLALNLLQLALVTLLPFSCSLTGSFPDLLVSQVVYSINMFLLSAAALLIARYVHRHTELSPRPMPAPVYEGVRMRIGGLMLISVLAAAIGYAFSVPTVGNVAFMLMAVINPLSRRAEKRKLAQLAHAATAPAGDPKAAA